MGDSASVTAIIGVGNRAAGDDAIGSLVLDSLRTRSIPANTVLVDAGLAGPGLVSQMEGYARAVLVDAVDMGLPPGAVRTFTPTSVRSVKPRAEFSLHGCDLLEVLELARRLGVCPPEVVVVGIQPKQMAPQAEVSPELLDAVPEATEEAIAAARA